MTSPMQKASELVAHAASICVLTGAGISAESGIKTFRDAGGLWENHSIEAVATPEGFEQNPRLVWEFYNARRKAAKVASPNPAHLALARLEQGRLHRAKQKPTATNGHGKAHRQPQPITILTQNVDGLHQHAGSQNVVELHGSVWKVRCTRCGAISDDHPVELPVLPYCSACGALLRPHIVWFGESLDPGVLDAAEVAVEECDLFLVIGTSAVVQPAASYPFIATRHGKPVIEVNKEKTPVSAIATVSLIGLAGEILPKIV